MDYFNQQVKLLVLFFSITLAGVLPAQAFTVELQNNLTASGWATKKLAVNLDPTCANDPIVTSALNSAIAIWNSVPTSSLTLSVGATQALGGSIASFSPPNNPSYSGGLLIYCDTNFDADFNVPINTIPGIDIPPTLNCASGQTFCPIVGGLVVLNAQASDLDNVDNLNNYSAALVPVIIAHELGHALGLGHSSSINALMYYDASAKTKLALAQDDANGISYLYPRNELGGAGGVFGCGSLEVVRSHYKNKLNPNQASHSEMKSFSEFSLLLLSFYSIVLVLKTRKRRKLTHGSGVFVM